MKTASQIMSTRIESVSRSDSLQRVAEKMARNDIGAMPVVEGDQPVGVVTDRDLVTRGLARRLDPELTKVQEVMSDAIYAVQEDSTLEKVAEVMRDHQVRRVLVFDDDKKLKGMISLADLALEDAGGTITGDVLRSISEPTAVASQ